MLPEMAEAMSRLEAPRFAAFLLIKLPDQYLRLWTGVGPIEVEADEVDEDGGEYLGVGLINEFPPLRQLIGGLAERIDFSLSGVDDLTLSLADEDASQVREAPVHVGIVFFDRDWQAVDPVSWIWEGTADSTSVSRQAGSGQIGQSIRLSVASAFTDRTRPELAFLTDADQRKRSPTDSFCSRVNLYDGEHTVSWPAPP